MKSKSAGGSRRGKARSASRARAKASAIKAADAIAEEAAGLLLPVAGKLAYKLCRTVVQHVGWVVVENQKDAATGFDSVVERHEERFEQLEREIHGPDGLKALRSQLTLCARAFQEAGRHPNPTLREALGRFAARVLHTDLDSVRAFRVSNLLAQFTALDYEFLRVAVDITRRGIAFAGFHDGQPVEDATYARGWHGAFLGGALQPLIARALPGVTVDDIDATTTRFMSEGLLRETWLMPEVFRRVGGGGKSGESSYRQATRFAVEVIHLAGVEDFEMPGEGLPALASTLPVGEHGGWVPPR